MNDPRDIANGHEIPSEGYCDQPYVVQAWDGAWLCTMITARDPNTIEWKTLPEGDHGLRSPEGAIAEEPSLTGVSDGTLFCTYRTVAGHPCHAYSRDNGCTRTEPAFMTAYPGGPGLNNPRGPNFVRRLEKGLYAGRYLCWFYNRNAKGYDAGSRNRAWLGGGIEKESPAGKIICWGSPEVVFHTTDWECAIGNPDFIGDGARLFITETQKVIARVHEIPGWFLKRLWKRMSHFFPHLAACALGCTSWNALAETGAPAFSDVKHGLKVGDNQRYLADAVTGKPVFMLADTAWNLHALKMEEVDTYLQSRADHGFNTIMFTLNFFPQAEAKNAYGQPAYIGAEHHELNPAYFETCDKIVQRAAARGLYVMLYTLWAGTNAGTMNGYTAAQLFAMGHALGKRYAGAPNVIFCVGGEATPPNYIDAERTEALGLALKEGCAGRNLVTVHPESGYSSSSFFANSSWLDFSLCQGKSSNEPKSTAYDAAVLVARDWATTPAKPTMMGEHRYESGTEEDPLIQRRSLYQCVFAGAFGHAYGHNALWPMTPHTAQPWMLKNWSPGVKSWTEALDTPAVRQLHHIKALLYSHPYFPRIPDQSLILAGQGVDVATRIQATRDGTAGNNDATYLMAYLSAPLKITPNTAVIPARTLNAYWFSPETGLCETIRRRFDNPGSITLEPKLQNDWVVVIEAAARNYPQPSKD